MGRFSGFSSVFAIGQGAAQALFRLLQMPAHCGLADAQGFARFLHGHALEKIQLHALPLPGGQLLLPGPPEVISQIMVNCLNTQTVSRIRIVVRIGFKAGMVI